MTMQSRRNIIVIGSNFAGISAARSLHSRYNHVTILDPQPEFEWYPHLHEIISRQKKPPQLRINRAQLIQRLGHQYLPTAATAIDRRQQRVLTSSGQWLAYDDLIIAVGSQSNNRLVSGARDHAYAFTSVADAEKASQQLQRLDSLSLPYRPIVLVGANVEGLEILGEMLRRYRRQWRFQLHVIDAQPALLSHYQGADAYIKELAQDVDIKWYQNTKVTTVNKDSVELDTGEKLPSRLTLWCAGATTNPLLAEAGLATGRSYAPVNTYLQSQHDEHVWIAGDAADFPDGLEKQGFYALAMGSLIARNLRRSRQGRELASFSPLPIPRLMSFGDTGLILFKSHALASPTVIAAKEAVFQTNINWLNLPQHSHDWLNLRDNLWGSALNMGKLAKHSWLNGSLLHARRFEAI